MKRGDTYYMLSDLKKPVKILEVGPGGVMVFQKTKYLPGGSEPFMILRSMLITVEKRNHIVARDKKYRQKAAAWKRTNKLNGR